MQILPWLPVAIFCIHFKLLHLSLFSLKCLFSCISCAANDFVVCAWRKEKAAVAAVRALWCLYRHPCGLWEPYVWCPLLWHLSLCLVRCTSLRYLVATWWDKGDWRLWLHSLVTYTCGCFFSLVWCYSSLALWCLAPWKGNWSSCWRLVCTIVHEYFLL